eukprot:jgi/Picre1/28862/NNA_004258.t1
MQQTIQNWNAPSVSPIWFEESKFEGENFNSEDYVDDLKRYIPLETLRSKLLALSTKLVNVDAAISGLEEPILAAKSEIESVRHGLMSHSTALKETLQRRHNVAELKASLELANAAAQSLSNVQKLVQTLEEDTTTAKARAGLLSHEALCKSLDRICSEMGRLLYLLQDSKHMQIIRNMEGQVASIKCIVENKLENALVQVLKEQDPTSLATLLHAYSTIGSSTTAEGIIRDCVIAPCCASSLDVQSSNTPSDSLERIQRSLKQEVWQFLEVAISTSSSSLPYDFPGQAVFPEVVRAVESRHPTMYSPGNPKIFSKHIDQWKHSLEISRVCASLPHKLQDSGALNPSSPTRHDGILPHTFLSASRTLLRRMKASSQVVEMHLIVVRKKIQCGLRASKIALRPWRNASVMPHSSSQ